MHESCNPYQNKKSACRINSGRFRYTHFTSTEMHLEKGMNPLLLHGYKLNNKTL